MTLAFFCALVIYGCSDSSGSGSGEIDAGNDTLADTATGGNGSSAVTSSGASNDVSGQTETDVVSDQPVNATEIDPGESLIDAQPPGIETVVGTEVETPVGTESSSPATVRVDFNITVPAYMSDGLQVRLTWGTIDTTAAWVRDQSWSISETFPADTENVLVVTFADRNGTTNLGTFERTFRTGTGESELVQIAATQFDAERWDNDGDGISNLDELIAGTNPDGGEVPQPAQASLELVPAKTLRISWQGSPDARTYRVLENPDGISGFTDISGELDATTTDFDHLVALYSRVNAQYILQACNVEGCADSDPVMVTGTLENAIGYFKASNTEVEERFGRNVSLSADGSTLAVSSIDEDSGSAGINGSQFDNSARDSGAVYVFVRGSGLWQQQAYIKASNAEANDAFGLSISLSSDGNTLAVGAGLEDSAATGVNGDETDNSAPASGAAYVFVRSGEVWQQQAYLKASNPDAIDSFGESVSLSADGNTLAVGAIEEASAAVGINGEQSDNSAEAAGAVYVFVRSGSLWQQEAYVKASNTDEFDIFGISTALSADGNTLVVGAGNESSSSPGVNANQNDNLARVSGAVYVFVRDSGQWQQQAYIKSSNPEAFDEFGRAISLGADGNTLVVGAAFEDSAASGINGNQNDNEASGSGAVYVFVRNDEIWQQQAYIKASNAALGHLFGAAVSLSADGTTFAAGAPAESSAATGVNGLQNDDSLESAGAVYVFALSDGVWQQRAYLKAGNAERNDRFGTALSLSADGNSLAVGALSEDSAVRGFNGDQNDNSADQSGAVYLY